jgi:hypothetical protein
VFKVGSGPSPHGGHVQVLVTRLDLEKHHPGSLCASCTMSRTLLVSFSLLALVVTARPIVPIPYVLGCNLSFSSTLLMHGSQRAFTTRRSSKCHKGYIRRTHKVCLDIAFTFTLFIKKCSCFFRQSDHDLLGLAHDEINIHLISDEGQQAVLSQLDGSAVKALVPLASSESEIIPEVQRLREMLGGSKHLDDIEGASLTELADDVEAPALPIEDLDPSGLTSANVSSPWKGARVLTGLSLASIFAAYTFISVATILFAFYAIRGFFTLGHDQEEKQSLPQADVESGYVDEKGTAAQEEVAGLEIVATAGTPQTSPRAAQSLESSAAAEKPWLVPLPPSPPPSPLHRTVQLDEDAAAGGDSHPAWAMVTPEEEPQADAHTGSAAAVAVDLALAMQLRTGFGVNADAAWLIRFVMAVFGWVAVLVGRGGERQDAGGRRLLGL